MNVLSKKLERKLGLRLKPTIFPENVFYDTRVEGIYLTNTDLSTWKRQPGGVWLLVRVKPHPIKFRRLDLEFLVELDLEFFDFYIDQLSLDVFEKADISAVNEVVRNYKRNVKDPTYQAKELFGMIFGVDSEGLALIRDLLLEEEDRFPVDELALLDKSIRFREVELDFELKRKHRRNG